MRFSQRKLILSVCSLKLRCNERKYGAQGLQPHSEIRNAYFEATLEYRIENIKVPPKKQVNTSEQGAPEVYCTGR